MAAGKCGPYRTKTSYQHIQAPSLSNKRNIAADENWGHGEYPSGKPNELSRATVEAVTSAAVARAASAEENWMCQQLHESLVVVVVVVVVAVAAVVVVVVVAAVVVAVAVVVVVVVVVVAVAAEVVVAVVVVVVVVVVAVVVVVVVVAVAVAVAVAVVVGGGGVVVVQRWHQFLYEYES